MEVLAYGVIGEYSAREFINSINENEDDNLTVRINSDGGSPEYGWGMIAKLLDFEGEKNVKVDGKAYSMGAFMCLYADNVEALDVSEFMVHRAAYPQWLEAMYFNPESEYFNEGLKTNVENINKSLEKAFRAKVDAKKFKEISGVTVKELFAMDWDADSRSFSRKDVFLNASQAEKLGIVQSINKITPKRKAAINEVMGRLAAQHGGYVPKMEESDDNEKPSANINQNQKPKKMTVEEFKSANPEAYNAIVKGAVDAERERVGAWMVFNDVDAEAVQEGIESGEHIGPKASAEFTKKMAVKGLARDTEETTPETTPEASATDAEKSAEEKKAGKEEVSEFEKTVNAQLGINSEKS